jgi:hypothetical protein
MGEIMSQLKKSLKERKGSKGLIALLLCSAVGFAGPALAHGSGDPMEQGPLLNGTFEIDVWFQSSQGLAVAGCVIVGDSGRDSVPSLFHWRQGTQNCGHLGPNPQAQWDIYPIVEGLTVRHVIKSRVNGLCLIRGSGGEGRHPILYVWSNDPDKQRLCGFDNVHDFMSNGQAAWDMTQLETNVNADGDVVYAGRISSKNGQVLGFDPIWLGAARERWSWATFMSDPVSAERWRLNFWSSNTKHVPDKPE